MMRIIKSRLRCHSFHVLLSLGILVLFAGMSGCAARQKHDNKLPALEHVDGLPHTVEALERLLSRAPETAQEAFVKAYAHLLYIHIDEAFQVWMSPIFDDAPPMLRLGRIALMAANYQDLIDSSELREWVETHRETPMFPQERVVFVELQRALQLSALDEADASDIPSALSFGGAQSWSVVELATGTWSDAISHQGEAESFDTVHELPLKPRQRRHTYSTKLGMLTYNPHPGDVALYESFVKVDQPAQVAVTRFGAQDYYSVWIDDTLVLKRHVEDTNDTSYTMPVYELTPGVYRVRMVVRSRSDEVQLPHLVPLQGELVAFASDVGPRSPGKISRVHAIADSLNQSLPTRPAHDALTWLLHSTVALLSDDTLGYALAFEDVPTTHPIIALVRAHLLQRAKDAPTANSLALDTVRNVDRTWPQFPALVLRDANIAFQDSQDVEIVQSLAAWADKDDASPHLRVAYAQMARALGFDALAFRTFKKVIQEHPQWCDAWVDYLRNLLRYQGVLHEQDVADVPTRCAEARWLQWVVLHAWRGDFETYNAALERAWKRNANRPRTGFDLFWQLLKTEGPDRAEKFLRELKAHGLEEEDILGEISAIAIARGEEGTFLELLKTWSRAFPDRQDIQVVLARLLGQSLFEDLRLDGQEYIESYRRTQDASALKTDGVYILRSNAWRWFKEGGGVQIQHDLIELNSNNAIFAVGEIGIPDGVEVLQLRIIKPDGTTRSPEQSQDRTALSMPNMEVGDILEREYLRFHPTGIEGTWTYRSEPFYFQLDTTPVVYSQLRVEYPQEWDEDVVLEHFNFEGADETQTQDGYTRRVLSKHDLPTIPFEISSPEPGEFLPWARFSVFFSREQEINGWADRILPYVAPADEIDALAQTIVQGRKDESEKLQALFRFVIDKVEATSSFFSTSARQTARLKKGDRMALYYALAQAAGFEPEVVVVRRFDLPEVDIQQLWSSDFDEVVLRVQGKKKTHWLSFTHDNTPFDYLIPDSQNRPGLILTGPNRGTLTMTSDTIWEDVRQETHISFWLDERGDAQWELQWTGGKEFGESLRDFLRSYPSEEERHALFETLVSDNYGQATLTELTIEGESAPDAPLIVRLKGSLEGFAEVRDHALVVDHRFDFDSRHLKAITASAERTLPLLNYASANEQTHVTIYAPDNYAVERGASPVALSYDEGYYRRVVQDAPAHAVSWTQNLRLSRARIAPENYKPFAQFGQQVHTASRVRLQWSDAP